MSDRFWKRLRDFCEERRHEAWMKRCHHDRKCPQCKRWFGGTDSWVSCQPEGEFDQRIICQACDHQSVWHMDAMLPYTREAA